jgi:hypothetical protein
MENDSAVACETTDTSTDDRKCITMLEEKIMRCSEGRHALNIVITQKTAAEECFEKERVEHNTLLQTELKLDNDRMKIIMRLRRATMRDITYT